MPVIEFRLGKYTKVVDGRPVDECLYQVHGRIRGIAVGAGLTDDEMLVELITDRDEDALDRNVELLRISFTIAWTQKNVIESQAILSYIEASVVAILGMHDPDATVIPELQVVLVIGGQHTGRLFNRKSMSSTGGWIDPPIERAIAGKNPFTFD